MGSLFLSALAMMGITLIIGFIVAGIIWSIAWWASTLEFYNTHQEELLRLKKMRKFTRNRHSVGWAYYSPLKSDDSNYDLSSYYQGENKKIKSPEEFYHETSVGASDFGLMDYYYPSETKIKIVEKAAEEEIAKTVKNKKK